MSKKYRVPVFIQAMASKHIGDVECDTLEEYDRLAEDLWEEMDHESPTTNISNDFDIDGDWDFEELKEEDLPHYLMRE